MNADNPLEPVATSEITSRLLAPLAVDVRPDIFSHLAAQELLAYAHRELGGQLTEKFIHNIRYISESDAIRALQQSVNIFLAKNQKPYGLLFDQPGKSGSYFISKLNLLPAPACVQQILHNSLHAEALAELASVGTFLYVDDASYSGSQAGSALQNLQKHLQVDTASFSLCFAGTTAFARKKIFQETGISTIYSRYHIPTFTEIFTRDELYLLESRFNKWGGSPKQTVLTYFEHKIPDNFFGPARRYMGLRTQDDTRLYFVDDTVPSPYRR